MKFPVFTFVIASLASHALALTTSVLRCENRENPHGIDVAKPRLSWILDSGSQSAYQIVVDGTWDSGKIVSDQSVAVEYAGPALKSQTRYNWRVKVWDKEGKPGEWSPSGRFVTGLLGFSRGVVCEDYLKKHPNPRAVESYLCAPPQMMKDCQKMLQELGVENSLITFYEF